MSLKASREPWRREKEKNPIVIQQFIEARSSTQGHVLDLSATIDEFQLIN
jgi:hypothetical protein